MATSKKVAKNVSDELEPFDYMRWFWESKSIQISGELASQTFWDPFWIEFEQLLKIRKVDKAKAGYTSRQTCQALETVLK